MTDRRFIPIALLVFGALVAGLWAYLSGAEEPPPRRIADALALAPAATDIPAATNIPAPPETPAPPRNRSVPERRAGAPPRRVSALHDRFPRSGHGGGSGAAWRRLAAELARRLDATAVRLRSNLAHSVFGRYALGRAAIQAGDPRAAIEHFDRLLARHPDNVPALLAKANALIAVDRFQEATKVYRHVVRLAPRDGAVRYNYGVLLCRQVEFAAAVEQFRQLVRIDPDHARGWHNLATLAQRAGRLAEARDAWLAFTRLEPAAADGWFQLGVVWMDFDKPDQAAACFNRFVALDTGDPAGWLNLGFSRAAAGRLDAALDAMAAARDLTPGDPTVLHHLADLHAMIADRGGPDAGHHRAVAGRLREQIDSREADRAGKRALAAGPSEDRE